jgi:hypothetical protein
MDSNHISDKRYLFAYGITDGALDDMTEEQRTSIIRAIECILKEHKPADSEQKYTPKVSK